MQQKTSGRGVLLAAAGLLVVACGDNGSNDGAAAAAATTSGADAMQVNGLKTPAAFASIEDDQERAAALFDEMAKVMQHPRCANCHPREGGPTQGDAMEPHEPPVARGGGVGVAGMECTTCHGSENVEYASMEGSIPGAEPWHLPPVSMGWVGVTNADLCAQLKNEDMNGGRSLADLVEHNTRDHLVNWAWHPGEGRAPAPGDQATFGALTAAWAEAGGYCPAG